MGLTWTLALVALIASSGCSSSTTPAGDAGAVDSGATDSGLDGGTLDSSVTDSGVDGGTPDSSVTDSGLDCSAIGCGIAPICGEACGAPCGCCPCADGDPWFTSTGSYVCAGGCYTPVTDGGTADAGPRCPADPPAVGAACANWGQRCTWVRCATTGVSDARCAGTWTVTTAPCSDPFLCGASCMANQVCLQFAAGPFLEDCAPNPCGRAPIEAACACSLCPSGAACMVSGRTITCNTCPSGLCP